MYGPGYTYAQVKTQLTAIAISPAQETAVANLPSSDPTDGGAFYLSAAQEKAFDLMPAQGTEIDGMIGFSTTANWDYNPSDRAVAGEYDLVGVAEHELTHALGRTYGLGQLFGGGNYVILDLYRYSAPGITGLTGAQPAYFSINGGTTDLAQFDTENDKGDWASSNGPDSFESLPDPGVENPVTPVDITELNVLGFDVMPCFLRGSGVMTVSGERAVEHLKIGDQMMTLGGRIAPIGWIGTRRIDCRGHPAAEKVWPARIHMGAFGEGKPWRDLLLSPDHAVLVDGMLVPVKHLVNGATIVQESMERVEYFHIELDRHDILLADGLAVESFLDTGNRAQFANAAGPVALPAPVAAGREHGCAPFRTQGAEVVAVRRRLLARAFELSWCVTPASGLRVLTETGEAAARVGLEGNQDCFILPPGTRKAHIVCEAGVPAWFDAESEDWRRLGASIGGVWIDGEPIPLESSALEAGFYSVERSDANYWRWTDGAATLRVLGGNRQCVLGLLVLDVMRGWVSTQPKASSMTT